MMWLPEARKICISLPFPILCQLSRSLMPVQQVNGNIANQFDFLSDINFVQGAFTIW